ncbi:MAG: four helix bundle protein [Chitinophagaceae bacterium]
MENIKVYDLEKRTEIFSLSVRDFCIKCKKDIINREYIIQLIRSAGSVGANYIEANDGLGDKDKKMRMRICKKESKENIYWLKHVMVYESLDLEKERINLLSEANQLMLIFAAILKKLEL